MSVCLHNAISLLLPVVSGLKQLNFITFWHQMHQFYNMLQEQISQYLDVLSLNRQILLFLL